MSYSFKPDDQSVTAGLRRIALDQIDSGLAEIDDTALPKAERIHQARKRCKKLRGLIRLVRPVFPDYQAENKAFRDAARSLSDVRDAGAMVETLDRIDAHFDSVLYKAALTPIRKALEDTARAAEASEDLDDRVDAFRAALVDGRDRAAGWVLEKDGPDAVTGGLAKTFGRARKAMSVAGRTRHGEDLHEWRKRAKYHWYHARLLKHTAKPMAPHLEMADRVSDLLGAHHDLHVMAAQFDRLSQACEPAQIEAFRALVRERQRVIEGEVFPLGATLFEEKPKAIANRMGTYWSVWREESAAAA